VLQSNAGADTMIDATVAPILPSGQAAKSMAVAPAANAKRIAAHHA
jgi:hypothetical protein